jgi:hypothetical protein
MTPVCRPTPLVRFMPMSETSSKQLMHCMAHETAKTVVFLPVALRNGTRTLFSCLCAKELHISSFWENKSGNVDSTPLQKGTRLSSPWLKRRGFQARRLVNLGNRLSCIHSIIWLILSASRGSVSRGSPYLGHGSSSPVHCSCTTAS